MHPQLEGVVTLEHVAGTRNSVLVRIPCFDTPVLAETAAKCHESFDLVYGPPAIVNSEADTRLDRELQIQQWRESAARP